MGLLCCGVYGEEWAGGGSGLNKLFATDEVWSGSFAIAEC